MLFLMEFEIELPLDDGSEARAELIRRERERAREIGAAGHFKYIWIVPGRRARIAVWEANDAAHLHQLFTSLPAHYWSNVIRLVPIVPCDTNDLITA